MYICLYPICDSRWDFFTLQIDFFFGFLRFYEVQMQSREIYHLLDRECQSIPVDSIRSLASYVKTSIFDSIPVPVTIFSQDIAAVPMLVRRLKRTGKRLVVHFEKKIRLHRPSKKILSTMISLSEQFEGTLVFVLGVKKLTAENFDESLATFFEIPLPARSCIALESDNEISMEVFLKFSRKTRTPMVLNMGVSNRPPVKEVFRSWDRVSKVPHVIVSSYVHISLLKVLYVSTKKIFHVELWKN